MSEFANPFSYTGRFNHAEIGLMYFRARYYDPATGEFISRDPLEYVDGMSLYRAYFVPRGVDPTGMKDDTFVAKLATHKYGVTAFTLSVHDPRLILLDSNNTAETIPIGRDVKYRIEQLFDSAGGKELKKIGLAVGADVEIDSRHDCAECYWSQIIGDGKGGIVYDGGAKRYPFQEVVKGYANMEDHPGYFSDLSAMEFARLYNKGGIPEAGPILTFNFPKEKIGEFWKSVLKEGLKNKTEVNGDFFSQLICIVDGKEEAVGQWQWRSDVLFSEGEVKHRFSTPEWVDAN